MGNFKSIYQLCLFPTTLVNLTLNMRYKNYKKKYQICHHQIRFYKLKMHQNPFSAPRRGSLRRSLRPPSRLHSPRSTPSASRTRRLGSQALSTQNPGYATGHMYVKWLIQIEAGRGGTASALASGYWVLQLALSGVESRGSSLTGDRGVFAS